MSEGEINTTTPEIKISDTTCVQCETCGAMKEPNLNCAICSEIETQGFQPDRSMVDSLAKWVPFYVIEALNVDGVERCECCGKPCRKLIHIRSVQELITVDGDDSDNVFLKVCLTGRCGELLCGQSNWKSAVVKRALKGDEVKYEEAAFNPPRGLMQ